MTITDIYGRQCYVAAQDWEDRERCPILVPMRYRNGAKYSATPYAFRAGDATHIHRATVARAARLDAVPLVLTGNGDYATAHNGGEL